MKPTIFVVTKNLKISTYSFASFNSDFGFGGLGNPDFVFELRLINWILNFLHWVWYLLFFLLYISPKRNGKTLMLEPASLELAFANNLAGKISLDWTVWVHRRRQIKSFKQAESGIQIQGYFRYWTCQQQHHYKFLLSEKMPDNQYLFSKGIKHSFINIKKIQWKRETLLSDLIDSCN